MQTRMRREEWNPFSVFLTVGTVGVLDEPRRVIPGIQKTTTTTPCFPGPGVRARVVVAFPLKGLIGLGRILQDDSRSGLSIPTATHRIVVNPHEYWFPAACGAAPPRWFWGWLCLWITLRDVPVYRGVKIEMSLFMGRRQMAAFCALWITFNSPCRAMKNYSAADRRDRAWIEALHGFDVAATRRFSWWLWACNASLNVPVYGARCPRLQDGKRTKCPRLQGTKYNIINVLCNFGA